MKKTERRAVILFLFLAVLMISAAAGRNFMPHDPYATCLENVLLRPSVEYPFGTDNLGRCILSRILEGAAASLYSSLAVVAAAFLMGTTVGLVAGYAGGFPDRVLMRITMVFQAFPGFILAVAVAGMLGPGLKNAVLSLTVMYWPSYARLARSLTLRIREETYIKAAKLCGAGNRHILFSHILPNILSPMLTTAVLDISNVILSMSGLSFLGLGVQAPLAEWGVMISSGRPFLQTAPWCVFFPSMALFVSVILFSRAGEYICDILRPGGEK